MDLEDWELLPKDLDQDEDHYAEVMITRNTKKSFDMDYFICPTQDSVRSTVVPTQLLHVPITWEPVSTVEDTDHKKNQDSVPSPRLTFKTDEENEFVDMRIDLPERFTSPLPQNDEKDSVSGEEYDDEMGTEGENENICGEKVNLWKMGLHGIGAICSFGVAAAAATFCVFFLGHNTSIQGCRNKNKNQILRFQIYSDDNKRMNEVVKHATKLNEAISVMKGLPVARAQICYGGYYDGL
ncbi:unnamed protein product [Eruca vesicaria subsp. sativa]|uniref:DUF6821 domain-containing protein n=1 Tax=Eruca vesicaria subsp. sativa TaxID=29727 RepID=A0ABC8LD28_ERUVS|nr:unnamed protein product [Eruca vesicaria subsp. sativa]